MEGVWPKPGLEPEGMAGQMTAGPRSPRSRLPLPTLDTGQSTTGGLGKKRGPLPKAP